jgi:hypothetical protein
MYTHKGTKFFSSEKREDQLEGMYAQLAGVCGVANPPRNKRVYSISYRHHGADWLVTVGKRRRETTSHSNWPRDDFAMDTISGEPVTAIFEGDPLHICQEPGRSQWANPSLVTQAEVRSVTYFDDV